MTGNRRTDDMMDFGLPFSGSSSDIVDLWLEKCERRVESRHGVMVLTNEDWW